jgi:hypothetical protein
LKKRTKKLLRIGLGLSGEALARTNESFLVLFFKKEPLSLTLRQAREPLYHIHHDRWADGRD